MAGNVPVPFLPTDTVDQIILGGPPETGRAHRPRPGLISVINGSGLQVNATQGAYPNEEVIILTGTVGNPVCSRPASRPWRRRT